MIYWISLIIVIICVVVIAVIVVRKFPRLVIIDLSTMTSEKESEMKNKLIWQRISRKTRERGAPIVDFWGNLKKRTIKYFEDLQDKAQRLEKKYTAERKITKQVKLKPEAENRLQALLDEAGKLLAEDKFGEAEARFIEVIGRDSHNADAYRGLADLYFKTKQYEQAKETLDFIIKLRGDDDKTYAMHGEIAFLEGNHKEAKEYFIIALARNPNSVNHHLDLAKIHSALGEHMEAQVLLLKAKKLEPKNPKILDFLIENSIILGNKDSAKEHFKEFKAQNPENPKLEEWKKKIKELS